MGKGRGTGSAFKPFVLADGADRGHPADRGAPGAGCITLTSPAARCRGTCTTPTPAKAHRAAPTSIEGTVDSFNTLFAQLVLQVGPNKAVDMAHKLGITTQLQPCPSAVLGSNNIQPLDMASVYGTLANRGVHVDPIMIKRSRKAEGNILYEDAHEQDKAMSRARRRHRHDVLQQVIARGTGTAANSTARRRARPARARTTRTRGSAATPRRCRPPCGSASPRPRAPMTPPATRITVYGGTWPRRSGSGS